MKSILLTALTIGSLFTGAMGQEKPGKKPVEKHRTCGTMEHHQYLIETRPGYKENFEAYNRQIQEFLAQHPTGRTDNSRSTITIPVVVHVVYKTAAENISDAQAISQFDVLNADYNKLNADTGLVPALFKSRAAGMNVQFCLATVDPNGNPTNGITRKQTTKASFGTDDAVKKTAQGGDDAWDVTKYVNIWVCNLGSSLLGYGEFPTTQLSNTWGLVINYTCTGTTGTAQAPFNGGRTGTHEFGHCFNLYHIWGDDNGSCTGDDGISDTPKQKSENYNCPTFPLGTSAGGGCCNASDQSSMFMNYMDYVDDACMMMFTQMQVAQMLAVVNNAPWNVLQQSTACQAANPTTDDAGITAIVGASGNFCTGILNPTVTLRNFGTNALTSAVISYQVDNLSPLTYSWTGNLPANGTANINLPTLNVTGGNHTFTATSTLPNNNATDGNTANDSKTSNFAILTTGIALPLTEGFEGANFPPTGWTITNSDNSTTWASSTSFHNGTKSMFMENAVYNAPDEKDAIQLPSVDLTTKNSPTMSFYLAYKLWTNPTSATKYSDTLTIDISTDCGQTWNNVYRKAGTQLVTTTPAYQASDYVPATNDWRLETVDLSNYANASNAMIRFVNTNAYENNMYIDDINVDGLTAIKQLTKTNINVAVFPNPATTSVTINTNSGNTIQEVRFINILGETVKTLTPATTTNLEVDLNSFAKGVYFAEVSTENGKVVKRLVIK